MGAFTQAFDTLTGVPVRNMKDDRYTFVNFVESEYDLGIDTAKAGGDTVGVLYEPNDVDQPAQVVALGFAFVKFAETIKPGAAVQVGSGGRAANLAAAGEDGTGGGKQVGICVIGADADGLGTVLLK